MGYKTFVPLQMDELPPVSLEHPAPSLGFAVGGSAVVAVNRDPLMRFAAREGLFATMMGDFTMVQNNKEHRLK